MKRVTFYFVGAVLCVAVVCVVVGATRRPQSSFHAALLAVLPDDAAAVAWKRTIRPIAETPEMKEAVGELLSYDDGVFAIYTNGSRRISIYLAYWTPGKMSHRLVAAHTPDVCWVGGGWKKVASGRWPGLGEQMAEGGRLTAAGAERTPDGGSTRPSAVGHLPSGSVQPGEWRTFVMNGQTEHVVFWHLVGGKLKSYGTGYAPPWWSPLADLWEKGLDQREEQFFVRFSSNEPIEAIWDTHVVQHVLARIPGLVVPTDGEQ